MANEGSPLRYTDDASLPSVTDRMLQSALPKTRPYTAVVLKAGPNFAPPGPGRPSEVADIIWRHGKRNFALRLAGLMPIICPVADGTGVTGISIFDADPQEVEQIMSADPGVIAGIFTFDVHPTRSFPGSSLPTAR